MRIETKRLLLRTPQIEDAEAMHALWHSGFVGKYNVLSPMSLENMREKLKNDAEDGKNAHIVLKETGEVIGMIGVDEDSLRWEADSLMIDYFLGETYARKGYMTEALRALIQHLFAEQSLRLISARVFADNVASRALLEGLGFVHEGTLRHAVRSPDGIVHDDRLYSLLREEWFEEKLY